MTAPAPIWRMQRERYNLVGSNCPNCPPNSNKHLRPRPICPDCHTKKPSRAELTVRLDITQRTFELDPAIETSHPLIGAGLGLLDRTLRQLRSAAHSFSQFETIATALHALKAHSPEPNS